MPSHAPRIYPIEWLVKHARPSWKITLTLSPCHYEGSAVETTYYDLTFNEIEKIPELTLEYERALPYIGEELGIDYYCMANQDVTVRIPRRNGGHTILNCWYDHALEVWVSNKNLDTGNPKDKVITFQEAKAKLTKKPRKPRK